MTTVQATHCAHCGGEFKGRAKPTAWIGVASERYAFLGMAHRGCAGRAGSEIEEAQWYAWLRDQGHPEPETDESYARLLGSQFGAEALYLVGDWWINGPLKLPVARVPMICAAWVRLQERYRAEVDVWEPAGGEG